MSLLLLFGVGASAGTAGAITTTGTSGRPVVGGQEYMLYAEFRTAATARSCAAGVQWFDSSGTALATQLTLPVTDSTTGWTSAQLEVTAPATAAYAAVYVQIYGCAGTEVHYVDKIGLMGPSVWVLPE